MLQHSYSVQEERKRALPKPGDYTIQYSATMLNKGGRQYHHTIKSHVFKYTAVSGSASACELHGWPEKKQLGPLQNPLLLHLKDRFGNLTKPAVAPKVHLSSGQLDITCEMGQWTQTADGADQLQLAAVVMKPTQAFQLPGADQPMSCDVKLQVTLDKGLQLTHDYKMHVFAGRAVTDRLLQHTVLFARPKCITSGN